MPVSVAITAPARPPDRTVLLSGGDVVGGAAPAHSAAASGREETSFVPGTLELVILQQASQRRSARLMRRWPRQASGHRAVVKLAMSEQSKPRRRAMASASTICTWARHHELHRHHRHHHHRHHHRPWQRTPSCKTAATTQRVLALKSAMSWLLIE